LEEFTPTPEQASVIGATDSLLVTAGPGTGKTRTAIAKALSAVAQLDDASRKQVLFLSFSNAAIFRLAEAARLHIPRAVRRALRFTTYHALAADLLRKYGRFVGLPARTRVADKLEETLIGLEDAWPDGDHNAAEQARQLAVGRGLLTFDVLVPLATSLLNASPQLAKVVGRQFPLIIVDEFQDTSDDQWHLLRSLGGSSQVVAFGDPNQIIFSSLHAATQERMEQFKAWKGVSESNFSAKNFRCGSTKILEFAEALLSGSAFTKPGGGGVGLRELRYRSELRSYLALLWMNVRDKIGRDQTIGILAPSNPIAEKIAIELRSPPADTSVTFPVHTRLARDEAALDAVMLALAALRDYRVAPDERKLRVAAVAFLAMDLSWNSQKKRKLDRVAKTVKLIERELSKQSKLSAVAELVASSRQLSGASAQFVDAIAEHDEFKTACRRMTAYGRMTAARVASREQQPLLFEELRGTREPKGLLGYDADPGTTHVLSYHRAKGREFDYVAVVVDPRGESGKRPIEEARRLYYVCATRAKRGLQLFYYRNELGRVLGPVLKPASAK
jgi:DNA helicase II / ATP-dependent DNA helicase PcrA